MGERLTAAHQDLQGLGDACRAKTGDSVQKGKSTRFAKSPAISLENASKQVACVGSADQPMAPLA